MSYAEPVSLAGDLVTLRVLELRDVEGAEAAAADGRLWESRVTTVPEPGRMAAEIERRLELHAAGKMLPFVVCSAGDGQIAGMTTYMNIDEPNRRLEIGSTWLAASAQGTGVNAEAKLLLLGHAFEALGCQAVELRTHSQNAQSRAAIERLGARLDGVLRKHMVMPDGSVRDTAVYSILDAEWPHVREGLRQRLAGRAGRAQAADGAGRVDRAAGVGA
ncbi:GNAT family N-acetyltransferase [Ornithinimicrobium sp. Y1847]|uniref:GNAT family N-acetyltransferase n=1 Tax=unclassified Ornithinimicrobium TaxID=2615080 RepID=UPI003B66FDF2